MAVPWKRTLLPGGLNCWSVSRSRRERDGFRSAAADASRADSPSKAHLQQTDSVIPGGPGAGSAVIPERPRLGRRGIRLPGQLPAYILVRGICEDEVELDVLLRKYSGIIGSKAA